MAPALFDGTGLQKQMKKCGTEQKWLKNLNIVPLGLLALPGCLFLLRERLIQHNTVVTDSVLG